MDFALKVEHDKRACVFIDPKAGRWAGHLDCPGGPCSGYGGSLKLVIGFLK
jgi:hypothetical protein